jgi:hypothetical protein
MSPSKTGLNAEFYKWIDDVRRAIRKEKELREKLRYYERKSIGCNATSYDRIGPQSTASRQDIYVWLEKIEETKERIDGCNIFINQYHLFKMRLVDVRKGVLTNLLHGRRSQSWRNNALSCLKTEQSLQATIARLWIKFQGND